MAVGAHPSGASAIPPVRPLRASPSCRLPPPLVLTLSKLASRGGGSGFLIHRVSRLTERADGGIVGAQASGDARALRH